LHSNDAKSHLMGRSFVSPKEEEEEEVQAEKKTNEEAVEEAADYREKRPQMQHTQVDVEVEVRCGKANALRWHFQTKTRQEGLLRQAEDWILF